MQFLPICLFFRRSYKGTENGFILSHRNKKDCVRIICSRDMSLQQKRIFLQRFYIYCKPQYFLEEVTIRNAFRENDAGKFVMPADQDAKEGDALHFMSVEERPVMYAARVLQEGNCVTLPTPAKQMEPYRQKVSAEAKRDASGGSFRETEDAFDDDSFDMEEADLGGSFESEEEEEDQGATFDPEDFVVVDGTGKR